MEKLPLISVIVPVYKVEAYLDKCIASITGQTYRNLEILLVDDGSPDGSGAICDAWAEKDSRIRVIHKENQGAGAARNTGLDLAQGDYVSMIDSDDYLECHMYEHLLGLMNDGVDVAECTIELTQDDCLQMDDGSAAKILVADREEAMRLHIRDEVFCQTPPNKLYRRSTIGDARFLVGNLIDDEFFTYKVIGKARKLAHSSAKMYAYRQQPGSAMHKPFSLRRLQGIQGKQLRLQYLEENMPALVQEAKYDLFFTCLYAMQGCLRSLTKPDLITARGIIRGILAGLIPLEANPQESSKKNLLLQMAQKNFEGTARLLNFLTDIHVLT